MSSYLTKHPYCNDGDVQSNRPRIKIYSGGYLTRCLLVYSNSFLFQSMSQRLALREIGHPLDLIGCLLGQLFYKNSCQTFKDSRVSLVVALADFFIC